MTWARSPPVEIRFYTLPSPMKPTEKKKHTLLNYNPFNVQEVCGAYWCSVSANKGNRNLRAYWQRKAIPEGVQFRCGSRNFGWGGGLTLFARPIIYLQHLCSKFHYQLGSPWRGAVKSPKPFPCGSASAITKSSWPSHCLDQALMTQEKDHNSIWLCRLVQP